LQKIKVISQTFPHNFGTVNCYLIKTDKGFILIDTGLSIKRNEIEKELEESGCRPGNLKLIIITHGDGDHTGNCAYLSKKFGAKIAINKIESDAIESGNLYLSRNKRGLLKKTIEKIIILIISAFIKIGKSEWFKHDLYLDEKFDLSKFGFIAKALHVPGHSKGSIGILTAGGELFCGDLFYNMKKPSVPVIIDDLPEFLESFEKLKKLKIKTVYPGHGRSFSWNQFLKANSGKLIKMKKKIKP
jgi:hydroxyacylglutathione hydrolase